MAPLVRLGVQDVDSGEMLFSEPGQLVDPPGQGHPWGFVQDGEVLSVRLGVTVCYAELDVVALRIELQNRGRTPRHLCLAFQARTVAEDWHRSVVFRKADNEIVTTQMSAPTSRFPIRPEPHIDIVTGWRAGFRISRPATERGGFSSIGNRFVLRAGKNRVFSLFVSAASSDSGTESRLVSLVRERLRKAQSRSPSTMIRTAQKRWARIFRQAPAEKLDPPARRVVRRAVMILLRNTIRAQPDQGYGRAMGPSRGTFPSRHSYEGFWIWDSAFQALGFAQWDLELAKDNIRLMLHNQDSHGGLPFLHPDATVPSAQPPLLSWVAMEIYEKERHEDPDRARAFLEEIYPNLVRWNAWWFRHRDKNGNGLAEWGNALESGWDDSPRWDINQGTEGWKNEGGTAQYESPDLNAYLIKDLRCLGRMAEALGQDEERRAWIQSSERLARLVVDTLYDPQDNVFYDTHYVSGRRHKVLTPASFLPLWAGVPLPEDRVRGMIKTYLLSREYFFGRYPFPTVSFEDPAHDAAGRSGYWRGPVWLNMAFLMIEVLARNGFEKEARSASRKLLKMVERTGIHENYNARNGKRGANSRREFSWSAAIAIVLAMENLTHAEPRACLGEHVSSPSIHIGIRVRDRRIYGRGKEAWIHLANRTERKISAALRFILPEEWTLRTQSPHSGPADGWSDAGEAPNFRLRPGGRKEIPVRFAIPNPVELEDQEYPVGVEAVTAGTRSVSLGKIALRLEGPSMAPLPWLTPDTAADFRSVMHAGKRFRFLHQNREIGRSKHGLVGMLDGRLRFVGRQSLATHVAKRDFIRHALHLVSALPTAAPLRTALENLLDPGLSPQAADEMARELLETVVQQTRDLTGG
jgi:glycogen debranching enzyme